ncbi:hypothetical protein V1477_016462 [Vespula maculifrons]|uniref:Uncharacterized protein n=1 Tax=Vespula maculifrons TaxID=7453 RepID=A0ABD2B3T6_VESMC
MCAAKSGSYMYRMVSTELIYLLASKPPIDLQLHKRFINANFTVEEKQAPCIGIGTRNINNKSRCKKSEEEIRTPIGLSNFKPKLASLSLATDQKCESCSAEIIGSEWFPVDAAIRYCGYVSHGKTAHLVGILGFSESVHLIMSRNGWFRSQF